MQKKIITQLNKLEKKLNIKILYAIESGSRAWGFESIDSDWDVRFIYIHKPNWYLSIDEKKDNYEKILPNDIDLSGWELIKTLKLLSKSNPSLLEWLKSPIIYKQNLPIIKNLKKLAKNFFDIKSCMYHYLHMAESNYNQYLKTDKVKIKKYFYTLRPILACSWIERKKTMPPIEFEKLLKAEIKDIKLKTEINQLLKRKKQGEELDLEPKIKIIDNYITQQIKHFHNYLPKIKSYPKQNNEKLNIFFRKTLEDMK